MIKAIRNYMLGFTRYTRSAKFLSMASAHVQDAEYHRAMICFHEAAEVNSRNMAQAARIAARKV